MYGKIVNNSFIEGIPDENKSVDKQKLEMFLKGFLLVIETENPGLGHVCKYTRVNDHIVQSWEYSKEQHITDLKQALRDTDYVVIKIAEGAATVEEYAAVIAQRRTWRDLINDLMGSE